MSINCAKFFVFLLSIAFAVSCETTNDTSSGTCGPKETWTFYLDFAAEAIDKAKNSSVTLHDTAGNCGQKEALISYLEVADEMINKAKVKFPTGDGNLDCSDLLRMGHSRSGVYTISPRTKLIEKEAFDVYCDMETDGEGWTVIQRRGDFENPVDYFYKDWKSYKEGFGDLEKEFWLGNDNIFALTNQKMYSARFDLVDVENYTRYAYYGEFWIDGENSKYTLHLSNYYGDAGDSMEYSNNQKFTTRDQDNDKHKFKNCAETFKGAWWFNNCLLAHLNGENLKGNVESNKGITWYAWKGTNKDLLAKTEIKIRPRNLRSYYIYPEI